MAGEVTGTSEEVGSSGESETGIGSAEPAAGTSSSSSSMISTQSKDKPEIKKVCHRDTDETYHPHRLLGAP